MMKQLIIFKSIVGNWQNTYNAVNNNSGNWNNISGVFNTYVGGGQNISVIGETISGAIIPTTVYHCNSYAYRTTAGNGLYFSSSAVDPYTEYLQIHMYDDDISALTLVKNSGVNWNKAVIFDINNSYNTYSLQDNVNVRNGLCSFMTGSGNRASSNSLIAGTNNYGASNSLIVRSR